MLLLLGCRAPAPTPAPLPTPAGPTVLVSTSEGAFEIGLFEEAAPMTVANFLAYVDSGFYDGTDGAGATLMHRIAVDFVVQGGGVLPGGALKEPRDPIANEARAAGLSNVRRSVAMARRDDPDSASSQFFVNLVDNTFLDPAPGSAGYAVFGTVTSGFDVLLAMQELELEGEVPVEDVVIEAVTEI